MRYQDLLLSLSAATLLAATLACNQTATAPSSPASAAPIAAEANPDGSTLKVTAPVLVSPASGEVVEDDDPDLVIVNASPRFVPSLPLSYVFEVFRGGQLVYVSNPVAQGSSGNDVRGGGDRTAHEVAVVLDLDQDFTWRAYAVYQGQRGPYSETGRFRTYNRFGVSCSHHRTEVAVVACRKAQYGSIPHRKLPEFLERVAYDLNRGGFEHAPYGRLVKTSGNNCQGYSCDIICSNRGLHRQWDVLMDEDGAQIPAWNRVGDAVARPCQAAP